MFQPEIERYKTSVMQRIQHAVTQGYVFYLKGEISTKKIESFADKMNTKYHVGLNKNQKYYRKQNEKANATLFLYPKKNSDGFYWWLLATKGNGLIHDEEKLLPVFGKHQRLSWDNDYKLAFFSAEGKKTAVTWRMTRQCYQSWIIRIKLIIRKKGSSDEVRQALWSLKKVPGFSGLREQVKRLYKLFIVEWKRSRKHSEKVPTIPVIPYLRSIKADTKPLSLLVNRIKSGKKPFPNKKKLEN